MALPALKQENPPNETIETIGEITRKSSPATAGPISRTPVPQPASVRKTSKVFNNSTD
jgi:hypothetical protein